MPPRTTPLDPRPRRLVAVFAVLAAAAPWWSEVKAQPAPAPEAVPAAPVSPFDGINISRLTITGLVRIDEAYVLNQIRTRAGQPYSADQVQRDVARLLRTGRFLDVRAEPRLVDDEIELTLVLAEKPEVEAIEFIGARRIRPRDLMDELTFAVGDPLDLYEVRQGREAIERRYRERGYAFAEVTFDEEQLQQRRVVYTIVENQRVRVRRIRFEGNVTYTNRTLRRPIATRRYLPIFRRGEFDPDRAERDAITLQNYYRDRGFLDAEVSHEVNYLDVARERLELTFHINEGIRYTIRDIFFEGNEVLPDEELLNEMQLRPGRFFENIRLRTDIQNLETRYGTFGYIEAQITSSWVFAADPGQVDLTITIQEGEQFQVGWIEVRGNFRTQERVVRRELRFYPEEVYDITRVRAAERRLRETGLFTEARIEPTGTAPGVRDALVTVEENPRTSQFIAGVGASSDAGIVGNIVLENTNFDIRDRPRSWEEFFRGRAFRGAGQTMRIQLEPGTEYTRFRIDFREPYFMERRIGFNASVFLFERGRDGYTERRGGGNFSFDREFEEGLLRNWTGEIAFRAEYVEVADRVGFAARDIRAVDGGNYLSSVKLTLARDTTDSRFEPSRGYRLETAYEQAGAMGGDFFFGKLTGSYSQYWTVAVDERDRKSVVAWRTSAGQIIGNAPVFERFYAGGIGSFRGFDFRGISPRQGLRNNRVGGDFMVLTGAEYSFPIIGRAVRGVFFSDMGTVERNFGISAWRMSVGAGIRLTLDILGGVPMEFDLAYPVSKSGDDDPRVFSFFVGLPFF